LLKGVSCQLCKVSAVVTTLARAEVPVESRRQRSRRTVLTALRAGAFARRGVKLVNLAPFGSGTSRVHGAPSGKDIL
jgi:hypothetical protein